MILFSGALRLGVLVAGLCVLEARLGVLEAALAVLEAGLGVLEAGLGVLEGGLGVLEAGLGVLEARMGVLERIKIEFKWRRGLKTKKNYFSIIICMIFVFPGHTELLPGHTDLLRGHFSQSESILDAPSRFKPLLEATRNQKYTVSMD